MSRYLKVEGHDGLVRDQKTGAILNINKSEIETAREQKKLRMQKLKEEEQLKQAVAQLETDVKEIKSLLSQIAEKL
jgi:uncharacterized FlaG/YvyC family protein